MNHALDHVVIVVGDLAAASEKYRGLGFDVRPGGRHEGMGTGNALIGLRDGTYLELFAFLETSGVEKHPLWPLAQAGGGLAVFWLATDDLDGDLERLKNLGVNYAPPVEMSRKRPDGALLRFRLATPIGHDWNTFPCLIQDITSHAKRAPDSGAATNGISGIRSLDIATGDLDRAGRVFSALSGRVLNKAPSHMTFGFEDHRVVLHNAVRKSGLISITLVGPTSRALTVAETMGATILLSPD